MSNKLLFWASLPLSLIGLLGYFYYDSRGSVASDSIPEQIEQEASILEGKCTQPEQVDRWLLQQTWFYDPGYEDLAGAFGQTSFSLYPKGVRFETKYENKTEALFCIDGRSLNIIYYETRFVPNSISLGGESIVAVGFGRKLNLLSEDVFQVNNLTEKKMTIISAASREKYELFRKN